MHLTHPGSLLEKRNTSEPSPRPNQVHSKARQRTALDNGTRNSSSVNKLHMTSSYMDGEAGSCEPLFQAEGQSVSAKHTLSNPFGWSDVRHGVWL